MGQENSKYLYLKEKLNGIKGGIINDDGSLMIHTDDEAMFGNIRSRNPEYKGLGVLFNIERLKNLEKFGKVSVVESLNESEGFIKIEELKMDVERDGEGGIINKEDFQKILDDDAEFCRKTLEKGSVLMLEPKSKINTLEIRSEQLNGNKYLNIDYSSYFLKKPGELTDIFQNSIGYMHDRDRRQIKILADEDNLQKLEEISQNKGIKMNYKITGGNKESGEERGKKAQEGQKRDESGEKKDKGNNKKKSNPNYMANVWRMAEGDEISRAIAGMLHHVADTMYAVKQKDLGIGGGETEKNIGKLGNDSNSINSIKM